MIEIRPDKNVDYDNKKMKIFFAGSIENGKATNWQNELIEVIYSYNIVIFNPRRENWDPFWAHDTNEGSQFENQVTWELDKIIDESDLVIFYFDPNTKSPITLLKLGITLALKKRIIVFCPHGYFRKGNVDITCKRFGVKVHSDYDSFIRELKNELNSRKIVEELRKSIGG